MIAIGALILGAIIGAITAKKRRGNTLDMLQYAAGFGMAFLVVGMILTVIAHRMAL